MYRGEIPGFFFDAEKGKYFKVLPGHAAPGARYSKCEVEKRKEDEEKRQVAAKLKELHWKTRVQRSRAIPMLLGHSLSRAINGFKGRPSHHLVGEMALTIRMKRRRDFAVAGVIFDRVLQQRPSTISRLADLFITSMVKIEEHGTLVIGGGRSASSAAVVVWDRDQSDDLEQEHADSPVQLHCYFGSSEVISLFPAAHLLCIALTKLSAENSCIMFSTNPPPVPNGMMNIVPVRPVDGSSDIFDSKGTSNSSETLVATGTHNGFDVVNPRAGVRHHDRVRTESDVLALHWKSPTVLLAGARNGVVWLYDRRSRTGVMRLNHPSAVTAIRAPDEYRVTVAGMQHQLHTYDLRNCAAAVAPQVDRQLSATTPYISYPSYRNSARNDLGFDVSPTLGMIAAATEDQKVSLLNLWTGKEIKHVGWGEDRRWSETVRCISFIGEREGQLDASVKSKRGLLLAYGAIVEEWSI